MHQSLFLQEVQGAVDGRWCRTPIVLTGQDIQQIIRDLADAAIKMLREQEMIKVRHRAEDAAGHGHGVGRGPAAHR